jgi:hypothetical protein
LPSLSRSGADRFMSRHGLAPSPDKGWRFSNNLQTRTLSPRSALFPKSLVH